MMKKLSNYLNEGYYIACVDLEATCCNRGTIARGESEIIEFGCSIYDSMNKTIVEEFNVFVRPVIHPKLTKFCKELTTIEQEQVDTADVWEDVVKKISEVFSKYDNLIWVSWGSYDRLMIEQTSARLMIKNPMPENHFNLKIVHSGIIRVKNAPRGIGLKSAVDRAGITFEGTLHRACDDARAVAKVLNHFTHDFRDKKL